MTSAKYGIASVRNRRIKVSRFDDLNDPYEMLGVDINDLALRKAFRTKKAELSRTKGLICFSSEWADPVTWSHYGDKHRGLTLGFDVPDSKLVEVRYRKKPLKTALEAAGGVSSTLAAELMRTKFAGWAYEKELRLFIELSTTKNEGELHFYPYSADLKLREVILGHNCPLSIAYVRKLVDGFIPSVRVIKARLGFTAFRVRKNLVLSRSKPVRA
jgi:hypothetical protein